MKRRLCTVLGIALVAGFGGSATADEVSSRLFHSLRCDTTSTYPSESVRVRSRDAGRIVAEFSVDAQGRSINILLVQSDATRHLTKAALKMVSTLHCQVPDDWDTQHGPLRRFRVAVIYALQWGLIDFPRVPEDTSVDQVLFIGTLMPRSTN